MSMALLAAPAAPILLLTQTGHFAAAAFLITASLYAASCAKAGATERRQESALVEKSTPYRCEKSTPYRPENRRTNQRDSGKGMLIVSGVVGADELPELVKKAGWACWSSRTKLNGLLMIIADAADRAEKGMFAFACDRARTFSSSLHPDTAAAHRAPGEALGVLEALGVFELVTPGQRYPVRRAAVYCFAERFAKRGAFNIELKVTDKQLAKWHGRHDRIGRVFERKNPIIGIVRENAAHVEFSAQGVELLMQLPLISPKRAASAQRCYDWLEAPAGKVTVDASGTVASPISGCPRLIRPYLLMDGEDVVEMDISGAHFVLLPRIYEEDVLNRYGIAHTEEAAAAERQSLISQIESGDVYGGSTPEERKKNKRTLHTSLNMALKAQMAMPVTQRLIAGRPILANTMRAMKEHDHRGLGEWLRRYTSDIVNPAVQALHARGIPSIPITDGLMVRKRDAEVAGEELTSRLFATTGARVQVCAKDMTDELETINDPLTI
jgi:hypothetical protein